MAWHVFLLLPLFSFSDVCRMQHGCSVPAQPPTLPCARSAECKKETWLLLSRVQERDVVITQQSARKRRGYYSAECKKETWLLLSRVQERDVVITQQSARKRRGYYSAECKKETWLLLSSGLGSNNWFLFFYFLFL